MFPLCHLKLKLGQNLEEQEGIITQKCYISMESGEAMQRRGQKRQSQEREEDTE